MIRILDETECEATLKALMATFEAQLAEYLPGYTAEEYQRALGQIAQRLLLANQTKMVMPPVVFPQVPPA